MFDSRTSMGLPYFERVSDHCLRRFLEKVTLSLNAWFAPDPANVFCACDAVGVEEAIIAQLRSPKFF